MAGTEIAVAGSVAEALPAVESEPAVEPVVTASDADAVVVATEEEKEVELAVEATEVAVAPEPEPESEQAAEKSEEPAAAADDEVEASAAADHKRKLEDAGLGDGAVASVKADGSSTGEELTENVQEIEPKRQRLDGEADGLVFDAEHGAEESNTLPIGNGQLSSTETAQQQSEGDIGKPDEGAIPESIPSAQYGSYEPQTTRKINVPCNKVGVLIGKSGETIKSLQNNSRAKIQITRDAEADPQSTFRLVELIGTLDEINKAEQLIKAVIAEADAGGSPSLIARGFTTSQTGAEQLEIQVPNEKVGLIIGKGGETIRNLQTRSGARIQLIPQHLPEGDVSKERTVRVTGFKKQIDIAKELIKEVMNQTLRPSNISAGYQQQSFPPRGPTPPPQWGSRGPPQSQPMGGPYDYSRRDMHPPQATQYPPQPYGGYSQQPPPRGGYNAGGWEQRPPVSAQNPPSGGYDYYGQSGQPMDGHAMNAPPAAAPASAPGPMNYGYGQSQASGHGQPAPYGQSVPVQHQGYLGYEEPRYDGSQASNQQYYGQAQAGSQPGGYPQQPGGAPQPGYGQQQPYGKQGYGAPPQGAASYAPPRMGQSGDPMYHQGPAPTAYTGAAQSYPYSSSAPTQTAPAYGQSYGPVPGSADGYHQPSGGYSHHGGQVAPVYGQVGGGQPAPVYVQQGAPAGSYGQYPPGQYPPSSMPGYGDQQVSGNPSYGVYQGAPADGGYGGSTQPVAGYGSTAPVAAQAGYGQPQTSMPGYEQSMPPPQMGYGAAPGSVAPAGYVKGVSPQPGYAGGGTVQYDSTQMYGHQ